MVIDRAGRFDKNRALEQQIPMKFWGRLQKGETITEDGKEYMPQMVLWSAQKGLKGYVLYGYPSYRFHCSECSGF